MAIKPKDETLGETFIVAERAMRHRRYARLFAMGMTTTDPVEQAAIIARIRELLRMDADHGRDDGKC